MEKSKKPNYLFDYIKHTVDLPAFLESEIGCRIYWSDPDCAASTYCPLPHHRDNKPSFRISKEDNGVWIYHCFGCGSKGSIIDFCKDYFGLNISGSINYICKKFGLNKEDPPLIVIENNNKKINMLKRMEHVHIVNSRLCYSLLKKDFNKYSRWVKKAYRKMNSALDLEDIETIEKIGYEASRKINEAS